MPRPRERAILESGLKLNVDRLVRRGSPVRGPNIIRWTWTYTGEEIASGLVSADMRNPRDAYLDIQLGGLNQRIRLTTEPRHFGGMVLHLPVFEPARQRALEATAQ
jgi:hypothetical protein